MSTVISQAGLQEYLAYKLECEMLVNPSENISYELLAPDALCSLIQKEFHPSIIDSCSKIEAFMLSSQYGKDLSIDTSELIHLIFMKLSDEIRHFFLKESGLVFPVIKKNTKQKSAKELAHSLQPTLLETIHQRQQIIVNLLHKLRQLLHDYNIQPKWHKDWKVCVNEMFQLESKVFQWIHLEGSMLYPKITGKPLRH